MEVPPLQSLFLPLPKPERYGVYYLTPHFSGKNAEAEPEMRYCSMPPAGPVAENAKTFLFGVCSHTERYPVEIQEKEIAAAALCGAEVMRLSFDWKRVQSGRGRWHFTFLDHILRLLEENHMEMQGIYLGMPELSLIHI